MTINHDREFVDVAEEADARRAARRVSMIGALIVFVVGFGLISLLMYGPIFRSDGAVELPAPQAVVIPQSQAPAPNTP